MCVECGGISINRLAADDDAEAVLQVFERSLVMDVVLHARLAAEQIQPLGEGSRSQVQAQLLGILEE
jgi:hypothetical protein